MKTKVATYVRVSSIRQTRESKHRGNDEANGGLGLEAQRERIARYLKENGFVVAEGFAFEEIESASSPGDFKIAGNKIEVTAQRDAFMAMVDSLTKPKCPVRTLVVQTIDRLSRNPVDEMLSTKLIEAGVELHLVRDGHIINRKNWHQHRFGVRARSLMAAEEGDIRTQRVLDSRRHKAEELRLFVGSRPPIGFVFKSTSSRRGTRELVIDDSIAPRIRELFELAATGQFSLRQLYDHGAALGLWDVDGNVERVGRLLRNPAYIGGFRYKAPGERKTEAFYDGNNPAIVSREVFFAVQSVLGAARRTPTRSTKQHHVFCGLAECASCGARMSPTTPGSDRPPYWSCKYGPCARERIPRGRRDRRGKTMRHDHAREKIAAELDAMSMTRAQVAALSRCLIEHLHRRRPASPALKDVSAKLERCAKAIAHARKNIADADLDEDTRAMAKSQLKSQLEVESKLKAEAASMTAASTATLDDVELAKRIMKSATAMGTRWLRLTDDCQREFLLKILRVPQRDEAELPLAMDWRGGTVTLRLRPVWQTIAKLAERARAAGADELGGRRRAKQQPGCVSPRAAPAPSRGRPA